MRKFPLVLTALVITVVGAYLVTQSQARPVAPTLRVGVMVSDSGPLYFAGPIQRAAAKLAVGELAKANEPVSVTLDFEDLGDSDREFLFATDNLAKFKPELVLAPIESTVARKFIKTLGSIPILAVSQLSEKLDNQDWVFRLATTASQEVIALAQYIVDSDAKSVAIVFSEDEYGRTTMRSLAMAFALRGLANVQLVPISQSYLLAKSKPDAILLASLEQSLTFLSSYNKYLRGSEQLYLVAGNQANYSNFPWSEVLGGAIALRESNDVPDSFRSKLASELNRPAIQGSQNPMVSIAYRTYLAIMWAAKSRLQAKSGAAGKLRSALQALDSEGVSLFSDAGFINKPKYTIFKYSAKGLFSAAGDYDPKQ